MLLSKDTHRAIPDNGFSRWVIGYISDAAQDALNKVTEQSFSRWVIGDISDADIGTKELMPLTEFQSPGDWLYL